MPIAVEQTSTLKPGEALLAITGHPNLDPSSLRLAVEQPGKSRFLQAYGTGETWGTTRTWLAPDDAWREAERLHVVLGATATWNLMANVTYLVHLADDAGETASPERMAWKAIRLPSEAPAPLAERPAPIRPAAVDHAPVEPEAPAEAAPPAAEPAGYAGANLDMAGAEPITSTLAEREEAPSRSLRLPLALLAGFLLLALAGIVVWRMSLLDSAVSATTPQTPAAGEMPQVAGAAAAGPMDAATARTYLQQKPMAETAFSTAQAYLGAATPDSLQGALLLLTYAAQAGNAGAATAIGKMYDPETFSATTSAVGAADPEKAYLWYDRGASSNDPEALYRLGQLMIKGRVEGPGVSPEAGIKMLEKAAGLGHVEAKAALDKLH